MIVDKGEGQHGKEVGNIIFVIVCDFFQENSFSDGFRRINIKCVDSLIKLRTAGPEHAVQLQLIPAHVKPVF